MSFYGILNTGNDEPFVAEEPRDVILPKKGGDVPSPIPDSLNGCDLADEVDALLQ